MASKRKLPRWCKTAKMTMIARDMRIGDIVEQTGYSRQHITAVLNGRLISQPTINEISNMLGITNHYDGEDTG